MTAKEQNAMKDAAKALEGLLDCIEGILSEQGVDGLLRYSADPNQMVVTAQRALSRILNMKETRK